jgi:hypothetical protein
MNRKMVVGGGVAAALLSLGTLIGGVATGMVGAQSPQPAQTAPSPAPNQGAEAEGPEAPVTLAGGSVSQDAAKQAATAYIQQTAPYNAQGLSATKVKVDNENGTTVYEVKFSGATNQGVEVTVSPQGQVLKAAADNEAQEQAGGADAETNDDSPTGTGGAAGSPAPSPNRPAGTGTPPR